MKAAAIASVFALFFVCVLATELAPLHVAVEGQAITNEYIVLMKPDVVHEEWEAYVTDLNTLFSGDTEGEIIKTWTIGNSFKAFHVRAPEVSVQYLRTHPLVDLIEENQIRTVQKIEDAEACTSESNAIWNLQRINTKAINGMNGQYRYGQSGSSIDAYIIDTGILTTHTEFSGDRAIWGANFADNTNTDCQGHGTHVAGTVGGRTVGVARGATLIAVKVLNCQGSGTLSGVLSGIQWTAENAKKRGRKSVANMSLGGGYSATENRAVAAVVDQGIPFAVAAGNEDQNACNVSPASETKAITVGATYFTGSYTQDIRSTFSNWGTCVDILAPGQSIKSAWIGSNTAYNTISGTSMASPHVCGVAALIFEANPSYSAAQVKSRILADSTPSVIDLRCTKSGCSSTPNKMLYLARC